MTARTDQTLSRDLPFLHWLYTHHADGFVRQSLLVNHGRLSPVALWLLLLTCGVDTGLAADTTGQAGGVETRREAIVSRAQSGHIAEALEALENLLAEHPESENVRFDLAVVAAWMGNDARTVELLDGLELQSLPRYALAAYARATRNLGQWERSLSLYDRLGESRPHDADALLGRALVLVDAGRLEEARDALAEAEHRLLPEAPEWADLYVACGYLEERARRYTRALAWHQRALAMAPDHTEAQRRLILSAAALGASQRALDAARARPGLLSDAQMQRLELDAAARAVRRASLPAPAARSHARTALEIQAELFAASSHDLESPQARALHFDHVAALAADGRMGDAVAAFEALEQQLGESSPAAGEDDLLDRFPAYVLAAAADAYLHLRRPARAAELYRAALDQSPENLELELGLFHAYSDLPDHVRARTLAERMSSRQPAWADQQPGRWRTNPDFARAQEAAALELAYRERYRQSLARLDELLDLAPANSSLRLARARVLRWQGRRAAALRDVQRVRTQDPENLQARLLAAELALDGGHHGEARRILSQAVREAPDAPDTLALAERWRVLNRPEVILEAGAGRASGAALSSREWHTDAYYFSAPIGHRYRPFVHHETRYARFEEGPARDHRLGAGVEQRLPHLRWRAEISDGFEDNRAIGAAAEVAWLVSDRLTLESSLSTNSSAVPLRASRMRVRGHEVGAAARYRWHDAREAALHAGVLDMNDDNRRLWLTFDGRQRVMNLPRHKLWTTATVHTSRNSETGRVYFNPAADIELVAGLVHEWRVLRAYDRALTQRLGVEAGGYGQRHFGTEPLWVVYVEHDWRLSLRARLRYGMRTGERAYDGDRERTTSAFVTLEWRP